MVCRFPDMFTKEERTQEVLACVIFHMLLSSVEDKCQGQFHGVQIS